MNNFLTKGLYDNCVMLSQSGDFMCYISRKKLDWYVKKDLAEQIDDTTIQLNFKPKGPGHKHDEYYQEERINQCVVCGVKEKLTKHHVVPYQYRKHFPPMFNSHTHFDVLMVCKNCHDRYEPTAQKRNKQICEDLNVPFQQKDSVESQLYKKIKSICHTLMEHSDKIPTERQIDLLKELSRLYGRDIILEDLPGLMKHLTTTQKHIKNYRYAPYVVEQIDDIHSFMVGWRQHFLDVMKPQFLSESWLRHYKTKKR